MRMKALNFHVRHEVNPESVWTVLTSLINGDDYQYVTQFDRQISRMRQIGLIISDKKTEPSECGREIYRIGQKRIEVMWELLHFLHYTQWRPIESGENSMFFTYVQYCNLLFSKREILLSEYRKSFAAEIAGIISTSPFFTESSAFLSKGAVSLSTNSLIGIEHWLAKLDPKVLGTNGYFRLRHYCSPELLLMSLAHMGFVTQVQYGVDFTLTPERRELVSQICMVDPESLNQLLDWLFTEYPAFVQPGTKTGSYGRFIRLTGSPHLKDLLQ